MCSQLSLPPISLQFSRRQIILCRRRHSQSDHIDCYDNGACWKKIRPTITEAEAKAHQLTFNRWQTGAAHSLGLAIAMKNAVGIIPQLHGCYSSRSTGTYKPTLTIGRTPS